MSCACARPLHPLPWGLSPQRSWAPRGFTPGEARQPGPLDWGASGTITLCSQSPCAGHTFLVRGHHGQSLRKKPPHSHKEPWRVRITFRRFQLQI